MSYTIDVAWDEESEVWFAVCDDIPVALESSSFDELIERVKAAAYEILVLNNKVDGPTHLCFQTARLEKIIA